MAFNALTNEQKEVLDTLFEAYYAVFDMLKDARFQSLRTILTDQCVRPLQQRHRAASMRLGLHENSILLHAFMETEPSSEVFEHDILPSMRENAKLRQALVLALHMVAQAGEERAPLRERLEAVISACYGLEAQETEDLGMRALLSKIGGSGSDHAMSA